MKIVHFSDPHAGGGAEDWRAYLDKRWVGIFNYRFRRRFRHDLSRLSRAVEYIVDTRPDLAVCTGDLTISSQPGEFERVLELLRPLRDSGIPTLYTPGNHDCYVKHPKCVAAVEAATRFFSHGEYGLADYPLAKTIGGVDFLLLNCARPSNLFCSWSFMKPQEIAAVEQWCSAPHDRPRILVSHYPMTEDHPLLRIRHRLFGNRRVMELMEQKAIDLVLCGHIHKPYLKVDADGRGECCAGSVTSNRGFFEIEVTPDGKFSFRRVDV